MGKGFEHNWANGTGYMSVEQNAKFNHFNS
jgi:hypothetical protein